MPKKSQGRGEAARGKKQQLESNGWKKVEAKENRKPTTKQQTSATNGIFRCYRCFGARHFAIDCKVSEENLPERRRAAIARYGKLPPRVAKSSQAEAKTKQPPKTTPSAGQAQAPTQTGNTKPAGTTQTRKTQEQSANTWAQRLRGTQPQRQPQSTDEPADDPRWLDQPELMATIGEELTAFAILLHQERAARVSLAVQFSQQAPQSSCTVCVYCAELVHPVMLAAHTRVHVIRAQQSLAVLEGTERSKRENRLAAEFMAFLRDTAPQFREQTKVLQEKQQAKVDLKNKSAAVEAERKKEREKKKRAAEQTTSATGSTPAQRQRNPDSPNVDGASRGQKTRRAEPHTPPPATGQEQATKDDEEWEGRCAAEAVHLALDYAGHLSPALARFLATVQQKGVPLSPYNIVRATGAHIGHFAEKFDHSTHRVAGHSVAQLITVEGTYMPDYFWYSDGTKFEAVVAIVRTEPGHVEMLAASEVDHSVPVELMFYEATAKDARVSSWTNVVKIVPSDDTLERPGACGRERRGLCPGCNQTRPADDFLLVGGECSACRAPNVARLDAPAPTKTKKEGKKPNRKSQPLLRDSESVLPDAWTQVTDTWTPAEDLGLKDWEQREVAAEVSERVRLKRCTGCGMARPETEFASMFDPCNVCRNGESEASHVDLAQAATDETEDDADTEADSTSESSTPLDILAQAAQAEDTDEEEEQEATDEPRSGSEGSVEEVRSGNNVEEETLFSHDSTAPITPGASCPVCKKFRPQGPAASTLMRDHLNGPHTDAQRCAAPIDAQITAGMVLCLNCRRFLKAPNQSRNAHRCGLTNRTRTENSRSQRANFRAERASIVNTLDGVLPRPTQERPSQETRVWTDGSGGDETRPHGGAAAFFGAGDRRTAVTCLSGAEATNQRAELLAVVLAIRAEPTGRLIVLTDSQWVVDGFRQVNSIGCHLDLWDEVFRHRGRIRVEKVTAHAGVTGNEVADVLSKAAARVVSFVEAIAAVERLTDTATAQIAGEALTHMVTVHPRPARQATVDGDRFLEADPRVVDDETFASEAPRTYRSLHRRKWAGWAATVMDVLRGYSALALPDKFRRQLLFLELPRRHLRIPALSKKSSLSNDSNDLVTARFAAVESLVRCGAVGKAAMKLTSTATIAKLTPETLRELKRLHPEEGEDIIPSPAIPLLSAVPTRAVHRAVASKMSRGAAPSGDGWTRELLLPIVQSPDCCAELGFLIEDILSCNTSPEFAARIRSSRLIPLRIGNKIRPIAIESAIAKLACLVGMTLIPESFVPTLAPLQRGVGGNVELVATSIRQELTLRGVGFFYDGRNAYNSVARNHMLRKAYSCQELRPIWGLVRTLLGTAGDLGIFEANGHRVASMVSSRGVRQGMILGPLLFALAVQDPLSQVQRAHPRVQIVAYLDDVSIVGDSAAEVIAAGKDLIAAFNDIGIAVNTDAGKSAWVDTRNPESRFVLDDGRVIHPILGSEVLRILGVAFTPCRETQPVAEWLVEKTKNHIAAMSVLSHPELNPQVATIILQQSIIPRMVFYVRTHVQEEVLPAAEQFDAAVINTLEGIVQTKLSSHAAKIARLPVRRGGLGMTSMVEISEFAHGCLTDKGAQKRATDSMVDNAEQSLLSSLTGPETILVKSAASKMAARIARDGRVELSHRSALNFLRERLLLPVAPPDVPTCSCGAKPTNQHIMCCQRTTTAGKIRRHDGVVTAVANAFASLGLRPQVEPRVATSRSRARPDLIVDNLVTDVTIRYPAPASATSIGALKAADKAAAEKNAQWRSWADRRDLRFAPLVFESTGALLEESVSWIRAAVTGSDCLLAPTTAADFVVCAALAALMRGNVWVVASALG